MAKIRFVPVEFDLRDMLGISTAEYILCWIIYYRQNAPGDIGWCKETKEELGRYLDMSKRNTHRLIDSLLNDGLIEQHHDLAYLRITQKWYDKVILGQEGRNFPGRDNPSPTEGENVPNRRDNLSLPLLKKNITNKTNKDQLVIEMDLPFKSDAFRTAWLDFVEHRKEIKKPMTARAAQLKIQTIQKNKWTEQQTIEYIYLAIEKGWQDIYQPEPYKKNGNATPKGNAEDMARRHAIYDQMFGDKEPK